MSNKVINDLYDYPKMKIVQDEEDFKFSLDSILLAEFVEPPKRNLKILDMCTGNAPIPLILSVKYPNKIIGFEIQEKIYNMAIESININNCKEQIEIINDDVKNIQNYFPENNFDIITCNPPYFKVDKNSLLNKNMIKSIARHEVKIDLEGIIKIASENLNNKGCLYMVHRPERLDEIIKYCIDNSLAVKKVVLVPTKKDGMPTMALIKAVKNGNLGVKISIMQNLNDYKTYQSIFR